jgi:hypothetical protein
MLAVTAASAPGMTAHAPTAGMAHAPTTSAHGAAGATGSGLTFHATASRLTIQSTLADFPAFVDSAFSKPALALSAFNETALTLPANEPALTLPANEPALTLFALPDDPSTTAAFPIPTVPAFRATPADPATPRVTAPIKAGSMPAVGIETELSSCQNEQRRLLDRI